MRDVSAHGSLYLWPNWTHILGSKQGTEQDSIKHLQYDYQQLNIIDKIIHMAVVEPSCYTMINHIALGGMDESDIDIMGRPIRNTKRENIIFLCLKEEMI
jgi:hypothetical protein